MSKLRKPWLLVLVVALLGAACGEEEQDSGAQEIALDVEAFDFYFDPTTLLVEPGSEVTVNFSNAGEVAHSFTVNDLDLEIDAQGGDTVESSFAVPDEPGSLDFYCKYHPDEMQGTLSIGGADQPIEEDVDSEDDDDVEVETETESDDGTTTETETDVEY